MLDHNDLKKGVQFTLDGEPYEVLESSFTYKARGSSTMQGKIKNLKTGNIITRTFHTGDAIEEAELAKVQVKFIYESKGKFTFAEVTDPSKRFELSQEQIGEKAKFLLPNTQVEGLAFEGEVITISLPIKMSLKVKDAPPGIKGDRSIGGTKAATLENGVVVQVPLFIETGAVIEMNTESGEYVRRIEKGE
jgi:elongation factor P